MVGPEIKFCGLTRAADAACAAELGAGFVGAIFASGPRRIDAPSARAMFSGLADAPVRRVGVFGDISIDEMIRIADETKLHVLQLHAGGTAERVRLLRARFNGEIWVVVRVMGAMPELLSEAVLSAVDAVVFDTAVGSRSGGTGVAFDWSGASDSVRRTAERSPVVLAGGLGPLNVQKAVRLIAPRVVDVSSGVESAPGIKDPELMRAFAIATRSSED